MTIVVTGGGSGGHITPVLAVAHEIKRLDKQIHVIYVGQRGDSLADIPAQDENIDEVYTVRAGKFRRYHSEGLKQLFDLPTIGKNIRDLFYIAIGLWQSYRLMGRLKPQIVFTRGGFVSVPVALGARLHGIPYITHDSDAIPSLANRLLAPWARKHAVALPKEVYSYPPDKTVTVGVPISRLFTPVTSAEKRTFRRQLGLAESVKVVFITGGGLGADRLNQAVLACAEELLTRYPDLYLLHNAGRALEAPLRQQYAKLLAADQNKRVQVLGFITNLHVYSGAADVVITRAGATAIAELAAQRKACIVVPSPFLTGGHQLKNAQVLADRGAARLVGEDKIKLDDHALMPPLVELLDRPDRAAVLGKRLSELAQPDAAHHLAMLLLEEAAA